MSDDPAKQTPRDKALSVSVVLCTNRSVDALMPAVRSLQQQTLASHQFELIVVNNAPDRLELSSLNTVWQSNARLTIIPCSEPGLSHARNAGLRAARGRFVAYLDDDAVAAPDWLQRLLDAYDSSPRAGVIGGAIEVRSPESSPWWYGHELADYWSALNPQQTENYECMSWRAFPYGANWSAQREVLIKAGGFDERYGRNGKLIDVGEEVVAALAVQALGYKIVVTPHAKVEHVVHQNRFTLRHLFHTVRNSYRLTALLLRKNMVPTTGRDKRSCLSVLTRLLRVVDPRPCPVALRLKRIALAFGLLYGVWLSIRNRILPTHEKTK